MSKEPGAILVLHEGQKYSDQVVYLSGHAYKGCSFLRCTFIVRSEPFHMENSEMTSCAWHIDTLVHDKHGLARLRSLLDQIEKSLLRRASETQDTPGEPPG